MLTALGATEIYWQVGSRWAGAEGLWAVPSLVWGWDQGRQLCFHEKRGRAQVWQKPELCRGPRPQQRGQRVLGHRKLRLRPATGEGQGCPFLILAWLGLAWPGEKKLGRWTEAHPAQDRGVTARGLEEAGGLEGPQHFRKGGRKETPPCPQLLQTPLQPKPGPEGPADAPPLSVGQPRPGPGPVRRCLWPWWWPVWSAGCPWKMPGPGPWSQ